MDLRGRILVSRMVTIGIPGLLRFVVLWQNNRDNVGKFILVHTAEVSVGGQGPPTAGGLG